MKNIGITGVNGFIGFHLLNTLRMYPQDYKIIDFNRTYFANDKTLDDWVIQCDVIVHLAALNRHSDSNVIYETNMELARKLKRSLIRTQSTAQIIMSSSSQEDNGSLYGKSKREGRLLLSDLAKEINAPFTGLIIPNVFGPFCRPHYNSVIATFCHELLNDGRPTIIDDSELGLIFIGELISCIIDCIKNNVNISTFKVHATTNIKVSDLLQLLSDFKRTYIDNGEIPKLNDVFLVNLFNTFRSYVDLEKFFPIKYIEHNDVRGSFFEIARLNSGGQVSFSTTSPNVTRGNHFHTRKVERFAVIKGNALVQLRKIGTSDVHDVHLSGEEPAYIDIPTWYAHNISNVGKEELYTIFWINEIYNPLDPDTHFEVV